MNLSAKMTAAVVILFSLQIGHSTAASREKEPGTASGSLYEMSASEVDAMEKVSRPKMDKFYCVQLFLGVR